MIKSFMLPIQPTSHPATSSSTLAFPLHEAIKAGNMDACIELIARPNVDINLPNQYLGELSRENINNRNALICKVKNHEQYTTILYW